MNKIILWVLLILIVVAGGYYLLNRDMGGNVGETNNQEIVKYFQEQMIALGIADIGHPIEGFDDNMLMMAFPGLVPSDFAGVEAFEGHYEVVGGESTFVRDATEPMSSAERTVSDAGYITLLNNVSTRLESPATTEVEVVEIIEIINTSERVQTSLGQGVRVLGITITPQEVLEDSRCPADAQCIWAGAIKVRGALTASVTSAQTFELTKPVTTEGLQVEMV